MNFDSCNNAWIYCSSSTQCTVNCIYESPNQPPCGNIYINAEESTYLNLNCIKDNSCENAIIASADGV